MPSVIIDGYGPGGGAAPPTGSPSSPNPPQISGTSDVFGVDLLFNGDLVTTAKGDYREVAAEENLRRAIIRRLITNPGEYRRNPAYGAGVPAAVKKKLTASTLASLRHRIMDQLSRERRLDKVLSLTLTPTTYDGVQPALKIVIVVQAKGRTIQLRPLLFSNQI